MRVQHVIVIYKINLDQFIHFLLFIWWYKSFKFRDLSPIFYGEG